MDKRSMIQMIRQAQREKDPRKRDRLWDELWESGLPQDATVMPAVTTEHQKPEEKKV